jgi:hypothetical protein
MVHRALLMQAYHTGGAAEAISMLSLRSRTILLSGIAGVYRRREIHATSTKPILRRVEPPPQLRMQKFILANANFIRSS